MALARICGAALLWSSALSARFSDSVSQAASASSQLLFINDLAFGTGTSSSPAGTLTYKFLVTSADATDLALFLERDWDPETENGATCNCSCMRGRAFQTHLLMPGQQNDGFIIVVNEDSPSFVFTALILCENANLSATYDLHYLFQGDTEVPFDAIGIPQTYCVAFGIGSVLALVFACTHGWLHQEHWVSSPAPMKLFALSQALWLLSTFLIMLHWLLYMRDGVGSKTVEGAGRVADVFARLSLIVLMLLLARGWGIWAQTLTCCAKCTLAGASLFLASLYVAMAGWYLNDRDPQSTTYVYDSPPGLLVCLVQCVFGVWFLTEIALRYRWIVKPNVRRYMLLLAVTMPWYFAVVPFTVGLGVTLPDYRDERVVEITVQCCTIVFYMWAAFMLRPAVSGTVFVTGAQVAKKAALTGREDTPLLPTHGRPIAMLQPGDSSELPQYAPRTHQHLHRENALGYGAIRTPVYPPEGIERAHPTSPVPVASVSLPRHQRQDGTERPGAAAMAQPTSNSSLGRGRTSLLAGSASPKGIPIEQYMATWSPARAAARRGEGRPGEAVTTSVSDGRPVRASSDTGQEEGLHDSGTSGTSGGGARPKTSSALMR